jgi:catechol 2,3-dioxygenase-like lactoylglutathione lyase family enzyme
MAHGARLDSVVMFVHDLDRSVKFYSEVLELHVADRSTTAALLIGAKRSQLILRAMGSGASHALGSVGPQYVIWTADDEDDLARCERVLKAHGAHRDTRSTEHVTAVEGHDPDGIVVMITYPGPDKAPLHELPVRIYGW